MKNIYAFIADTIADGYTVLAYDRRAVPCMTKHIKSMDRVEIVDCVLFVDGECAKGWTICRKP